MQRIARTGGGEDIFRLDAKLLRGGVAEVGRLAARIVAPAARRHRGDRIEAFLARPHGIFVLVDHHRVRVHGAARTAARAAAGTLLLRGILRHGEFVIERKRGAGRKQGANAAHLTAGKASLRERFNLFGCERHSSSLLKKK